MTAELGFRTTSTASTDGLGNLTIAHNHDGGSDGLVTVFFFLPSSANISAVTYNGVAMTLKLTETFNSITYRLYTIATSTTGSQNLFIDTDATFATVRTSIQSVNTTNLGTTQKGTASASPVSDSITVSENSKIYVIGFYNTTGATDTITANGVTLSEDYKIQFTSTAIAGISAAQTAGAKTTTHTFSLGTLGNLFSIELEEVAGVTANGNFLAFM